MSEETYIYIVGGVGLYLFTVMFTAFCVVMFMELSRRKP